MENVDKKECGEKMMCDSCSGCGMQKMDGCCHGKHYHKKMIMKLLVVIIIFACGFKLGELTGMLHSQYGYGMMRGGDSFRMMRGYNGDGYQNQNIPDAGTIPPVAPASVK